VGSKVAKRLLLAVPTIFGVSLILYFLMSVLPGDPTAALLPDDATKEARDALRHQLGLDQPIPVRYVNWLNGVAHGDLGYSRQRHRDVSELVARAWQNTAILAVCTAFVGLGLGIVFGVAAAVYQGRWPDRLLSLVAISGFSVPNFWIAILLLIIFSAQLKWLPASGVGNLGDGPLEFARHLVMPLIAGSVVIIGITARITRASVIETFGADFVDLLRAKGLSNWQILTHVSKNSVSPVLATSGVQIGNLLGGAVLVETIFAWPGLGQLTYIAISARDLVVVQASLLLIAITFVLLNIVFDLLQAVFDPRQRQLA
jgi:peptide/nickel transport system permease protein